MANDTELFVPVLMDNPNGTSSPKGEKRCATESMVLLENASTPFRSDKKRLVLECDRTPLPSSCLNSSSRSLTLSTPGRILSSSRTICITRGIQTCPPKTINRYCQVSVSRIRKPTTSTLVQTDDNYPSASASPPAQVVCDEIACQTDASPHKETSVATTQTIAFENVPSSPASPVQRKDAMCQENVVKEVAQTVALNKEHEEQEEEEPLGLVYDSDDSEPVVHSISNMLNDIAKQYGIDLQSSTEKKKKNAKATKKKQIDHLERCLVNKTYKAIASKVDQKLGTILEKHAMEYGRKTVASRQRLVRWTKCFIRQQQNQATTRTTTGRKVILVRKIVRATKRPPMEEIAVQCVSSELEVARTTVGTQWQRQKPMVTKKKPVAKQKKEPSKVNTTKSTTPTDSKTCSAGAGYRQSMRQTKLSSYAKEQIDGKGIQGRQQQERKQQGERTPKSSKLATATVTSSAAPSTTPKTTQPPTPPTFNKKTRSSKRSKPPPVVEKIHVEETPSASSSDSETERKHFPYRSPTRYPSQCSKSTETSFLTPSRIRNLAPEQTDTDRQSLRHRNCNAQDNTQMMNPSVLISPMERMYMEPTTTTAAQTNRTEFNTFLVPLRSSENIPPTPPRMVYLNPPERRVLLRSRHSTGGMVREKPPEISIISSQQLYSQIGLAVEKALKAKKMPTLDTMYGDPYIEVFNGTEPAEQDIVRSKNRVAAEVRREERATKQQYPKRTDKFVCSSGREDMAFLGSQLHHVRKPPFHTERSPSLSPIVYQDDNSGDEML